MACFNPMRMIRTPYLKENGKPYYKIHGRYVPELEYGDVDQFPIPCGKCLGCRLDQARSWADRMILELDHTKKGVFFTLTYNDEHLPEVNGFPSLRKKDLQSFIKVLRSRSEFENKEIRFYAVGEMGSHTLRPHYHGILFGVSLEDFKPYYVRGMNELKQCYYVSEKFNSLWHEWENGIDRGQRGFTLLSEVSYDTMSYVARYVMKKADEDLDSYYEKTGIEKQFSLMSRRPGLGRYYLDDHPELADLSVFWEHGKKIMYPGYFLRLLEKADPQKYEEVKNERMAKWKISMMDKIHDTDLDSESYDNLLQSFKKLDTMVLSDRDLLALE